MRGIDLNSDLGEGMATDAEVLAVVTSANVACGAHAGDLATMATTVALAKRSGAALGAHPGYPDPGNFGRKALDMPDVALRQVLLDQLGTLAEIAAGQGLRLRHVKAHGALYNQAERDEQIADVIADAVAAQDAGLLLFCPPGSAMDRRATARGLRVAREGFCDRAYEPDGTLRSRSQPGAVLTDPDAAAAHALELAASGRYDTLCVHGDTPGAPAIAKRVRDALESAGYRVAAP